MNKLLAAIGVLVLAVIAIIWGGWVLSVLWGWWLVPLGVPAISVVQALGVRLVAGFFIFPLSLYLKKDESWSVKPVAQRVVTISLVEASLLLTGWIYTLFL